MSLLVIGMALSGTYIDFNILRAQDGTTIFEDDFEQYPANSFPSSGGWILEYSGVGTKHQKIVDTISVSGNKSFQIWGRPGWGAAVYKRITSTSNVIRYEVYVRAEGYGSGYEADTAVVGFYTPHIGTWGTSIAWVSFQHNGTVTVRGPVPGFENRITIGTWEPNRWYKVKVNLDINAQAYSVWIDDVLKAENISEPYAESIESFRFASNSNVRVYSDDVIVEEYPSDSDGDGISDDQDVCPFENPQGFDADFNGCIDVVCDLADLVKSLDLHHGIENSLVKKVNNACKKFEKGNINATINQLQAFINQVEAQRGKKISEEDADMLMQFALNAIQQIQET